MVDSDDALPRRRFLLGTVGTTAALAGCLSDDATTGAGETDQGNGEPTATTESTTRASETTTAQPTTQSAEDETTAENGTTADEADSVCAPLAGSPTAYDVSGTSYVFAFDYPETWTVGDPIPGQTGRFQQITSPAVDVDGDARTVTMRVGQSSPAISASEVEAEKDALTTRDADPLAVVDQQSFGEETVDVLGFPDVPLSSYPPAYLLFLPYDSGGSREYYGTSIVTYSDIYGLEGDERDACNERIRTTTEMVRNSLRPNPDTTAGVR
jgi:hypothetical protein